MSTSPNPNNEIDRVSTVSSCATAIEIPSFNRPTPPAPQPGFSLFYLKKTPHLVRMAPCCTKLECKQLIIGIIVCIIIMVLILILPLIAIEDNSSCSCSKICSSYDCNCNRHCDCNCNCNYAWC